MKNLFVIVILLFTTTIQCQKNEIILENIKHATYYLASDELEGRDTGSKGIELAAKYLEKKLSEYGIKPYYNTYRDSLKVGQLDAYNLIGFIPGKQDSLKNYPLILSAHYDHVGFKKGVTEGDNIINGANDNAASVATVLEIGRYFSQKQQDRPIMLIFFTAEEIGLKGASHLAKRFENENLKPFALINFEMIGVPLKNFSHQLYITGFNKSNLAEEVNKSSKSNLVGLSDKAEKFNLFMASDNYPMYQILKFPSHSVSSFDFENYDYYHHVKDEAHLMDYGHLTKISENFIPAVIHLCQIKTIVALK
jgi:hypothetical protein